MRFCHTLPESFVVQNQAFAIDDNLSNESSSSARIPEASLGGTFVFLPKGLKRQIGETNPCRCDHATLLSDREAQASNGNGVGRGTPLQVDVHAPADRFVSLSVFMPF